MRDLKNDYVRLVGELDKINGLNASLKYVDEFEDEDMLERTVDRESKVFQGLIAGRVSSQGSSQIFEHVLYIPFTREESIPVCVFKKLESEDDQLYVENMVFTCLGEKVKFHYCDTEE